MASPLGTLDETCQIGKSAPGAMLDALPDSQAGAGRHKCCICAYLLGLADGLAAHKSE
jgi:hypothetical protein